MGIWELVIDVGTTYVFTALNSFIGEVMTWKYLLINAPGIEWMEL